MAYYCDLCDRYFGSWYALRQHYIQSPFHHFCRQCDTHFDDEQALREHCAAEHYWCDRCDRFFRNSTGLHEHNRQCHFYCESCRRVFNSESNLRSHMNSSVHMPRNVPCAFQYRGCNQWFINKSAMILHLEGGACVSGVDRNMINRWVKLNDHQNVITHPSRLITDGGSTIKHYATERSWNGRAYECFLCTRTFGTLDALNRHLASPVHDEKIYRCPLSSCAETFRTLSALCQHVESERCGVKRFRAVRDGMDNLLGGMRRLGI